MKIETKYGFEKVWRANKEVLYRKAICEFCEGFGEITSKRNGYFKMVCSECEGTGVVDRIKLYYFAPKAIDINSVTLYNKVGAREVVYDCCYPEEMLFPTREKAVEECEKLNNNIVLDESIPPDMVVAESHAGGFKELNVEGMTGTIPTRGFSVTIFRCGKNIIEKINKRMEG